MLIHAFMKHNADVISVRCTATVGMWFSDCSVAMPCPVLRQLRAEMLSEKEYCEIVPVMITRCPNPHLIDSWSNYLAYANLSQLFEGSTSIVKKWEAECTQWQTNHRVTMRSCGACYSTVVSYAFAENWREDITSLMLTSSVAHLFQRHQIKSAQSTISEQTALRQSSS